MKKSMHIAGVVALILLGGMAVTGCHSTGSQYERSTGRYIDDKAIEGDVEGALEDNPVYKLDEVTVKAFRGTVQLSGFVSTQEQKERASEIASKVPGVLRVENNISVKMPPFQQPTDSSAQAEQAKSQGSQ
jgi:hyperosmotically inducible periplasmic protein